MKKKLCYLLMIIISIVGSKLIFGKDYHLNSNNLKEENLYVYNIFNKKEVLSTLADGEDFYYISIIDSNKNNYQYEIVKYNLIYNSKSYTYRFNSNVELKNTKLFMQDGYLYLTSFNSKTYYKFDKHLNNVANSSIDTSKYDSFGILKDNFVYTINNEIYYQSKLLDTIPASCGKSIEIIYDKDTYIHFHNDSTGFGCLYNASSKKIQYLDYEHVDIIKDKLLEYQSNRISFKYDGDTYYFNDITESNNLEMHVNGDYLFTIDLLNKNLKIYNLETRKIIYEKSLSELDNSIIKNVIIDDYAYFILKKDNKETLYIWDYLKETRKSRDMIYYDEKEYKFKNNELKEEIKAKYNIDVYIYDQGVDYFNDYYVIPSYDDILINTRLTSLKKVLEEKNYVSSDYIVICFDKDIISNNEDKRDILVTYKDNHYVIAVNITDDDFKENITLELGNIFRLCDCA